MNISNKKDIVSVSRAMYDDQCIVAPEDFGSLVDLALDTKDKAWFNQLIHQYNLWVPAYDVLGD